MTLYTIKELNGTNPRLEPGFLTLKYTLLQNN